MFNRSFTTVFPNRSIVSLRHAKRATLVESKCALEVIYGQMHATCKRKNYIIALAYKARRLDGIWATAPYLHNGSVPNLYQLLLPAKDRMKKFFVGTREFDPVNVGFTTDNQDNTFEFDASLPGNSNAGHDTYGTDSLTDEQRWQLVEYLKTLMIDKNDSTASRCQFRGASQQREVSSITMAKLARTQ
jgi:hypothetical protein